TFPTWKSYASPTLAGPFAQLTTAAIDAGIARAADNLPVNPFHLSHVEVLRQPDPCRPLRPVDHRGDRRRYRPRG
ncbi:hypothetical protein CJ307_35295, partial [Klebsiella quasipneumoniae]